MYAWRKQRTQFRNLLMDFVGNLKGIALRLAVRAKKDRRFSISSDNRIHGGFGRSDLGDVTKADGDSVGRES